LAYDKTVPFISLFSFSTGHRTAIFEPFFYVHTSSGVEDKVKFMPQAMAKDGLFPYPKGDSKP